MSSGVLVLPPLKELEELLCSPLLKETHKGTLHSLQLVTWDLRDLSLTIDKAAGDLLELQVTSYVGVDEDLRELAGCNDELGDEVDSVVAVASKLLRGRLVWPELAVKLTRMVSCRSSRRDRRHGY